MEKRPTLLHSCARAATASEAGFRIDYPNSKARASRIIALDDQATSIMNQIAGEPWSGAHFLRYVGAVADANGRDALLTTQEGRKSRLSDELEGADVAVMLATTNKGSEGASIIGTACFSRRIMTAGLVVGNGHDAVNALRPYASVLVMSTDEDYVGEIMRALRA